MYARRYNPISEIDQMRKSFETFNSFLDSYAGGVAREGVSKFDFIPANQYERRRCLLYRG